MIFLLVYLLFSKNRIDIRQNRCYKVRNMKTVGTLRDLFLNCNLMSVYTMLYHRHTNGNTPAHNNSYSYHDCLDAYKGVIIQMLLKPIKKTKAAMPLYVSYQKEEYDGSDESYYNVSFLNLKYEEPPKNHKPWGGSNHPEGYYNCNLNKYNKFFAVIGSNWNQLINADVILDQSAIDTNITNEQLVAEILWEITFFGFTEKKVKKFVDDINKSAKKVKKSLSKKKK